jgi:hypothetical protein
MTNLTKFLALVLGFALWAALGYLKMVPLDPLIALLQMGLGGLITHMLQGADAAPEPAKAAPPAQAGFVHLRLLSALALLTLGVALSGCATLDGPLENRVACTVAKDKAFVVSQWGAVGITGQIAEADRQVVCK